MTIDGSGSTDAVDEVSVEVSVALPLVVGVLDGSDIGPVLLLTSVLESVAAALASSVEVTGKPPVTTDSVLDADGTKEVIGISTDDVTGTMTDVLVPLMTVGEALLVVTIEIDVDTAGTEEDEVIITVEVT